MQYLVPIAALAATVLPAVHAAVAGVSNHCGVPFYVWSVSDVQSDMVTIPDYTVVYNETYRSRGDNDGGISIKIAKSNDNGNLPSTGVSQFEYTITSDNVWYDLSNINGNPLQGISILLAPSESSCPTVQCASNDETCKAAYNQPNDDTATHACAPNADLMLTLCSDKQSGAATSVSNAVSKVSSEESKANALQVSESGVVSEAATAPTTSSPSPAPASGSDSSDTDSITQDLEEATTFVTFHNPTKRDVPHHAYEHIHNRIRRSRIFRHASS